MKVDVTFTNSPYNKERFDIIYHGSRCGYIEFKIEEHLLIVKNAFVESEMRLSGVFTQTLIKLVNENQIERLRSTLVLDNKKIFLKKISEISKKKFERLEECFKLPKATIEKALKETPAWKTREKIGFNKIVMVGYDPKSEDKKSDGILLEVTR